MEYLYNNTIINGKANVVQYVKEKCNIKLRRAMLENSLLPIDEDVCVLYHTSRYSEYLIRPLGILSDAILDDICLLPESGEKGYITVFDGVATDRVLYLKNRETIRKCIELFFKRECNFYYKSDTLPKGIFKLLDNAVAVKIINYQNSGDDACSINMLFKCLYIKDGLLKIVVLRFVFNFKDLAWSCTDSYVCVDKWGYDVKDYSCNCPELDFSYSGVLKEDEVYTWVDYINSNYDFGSVVEISDFYSCSRDICGDVLLECKDYYKYLYKNAEKNITPVTKEVFGKTIDCFDSLDLSTYSYTGRKSKYADIHMEKGEKLEVDKYYVYNDKMGFVLLTKSSKVFFGNIVPINNLHGETVLYGLSVTSSYADTKSRYNNYCICPTDRLDVLQNAISKLHGKSHGEFNYIKELIVDSKYYRYAGLVGIRDCKFSILFKFEDAIYAFIRYNGTIRLLTSTVKTAEERKNVVENIKKIVSIESFRKLCIKRVYVFNIYSVDSKIAASLNIGKKYIGNYTDLNKILELSKSNKNIVFSVSCINKENNKIESKMVLSGGSIVSIDGVEIEC